MYLYRAVLVVVEIPRSPLRGGKSWAGARACECEARGRWAGPAGAALMMKRRREGDSTRHGRACGFVPRAGCSCKVVGSGAWSNTVPNTIRHHSRRPARYGTENQQDAMYSPGWAVGSGEGRGGRASPSTRHVALVADGGWVGPFSQVLLGVGVSHERTHCHGHMRMHSTRDFWN